MDRMLYLGMLGARETALAQGVHTNNLANASTTGFRADLEHLQSLPVYGPGRASRVAVEARNPVVDFSDGAVIQTGRSLDVAVRDGGFIAIQAPDGSEAYTRAGDLRATSAGILTTGAGYPVLGEGGPIALPPATQVDIGTDGTITLRPMGQKPTELAVVDRIKLVKPPTRDLVKDSEGLFRMANGGQAPADAGRQFDLRGDRGQQRKHRRGVGGDHQPGATVRIPGQGDAHCRGQRNRNHADDENGIGRGD